MADTSSRQSGFCFIVVTSVTMLDTILGGSLIWIQWPQSNSTSALGYSRQSYGRNMAGNACATENGSLLDSEVVYNCYDDMKAFCSHNLDSDQNYWIANRTADECPTLKYVDGQVKVLTHSKCNTDMLRVICARSLKDCNASSPTTTTTATTAAATTAATTAATAGATTTATTSTTTATGTVFNSTSQDPNSDTNPDLFTDSSTPESATSLYNNTPALSWDQWLYWSECSARCNGGQRLRIRICEEDSCPRFLGSISSVNITYDIQMDECNDHVCPVWSEWSSWIGCNGSCDQALRVRRRQCHGNGDGCPGSDKEVDDCLLSFKEQSLCNSKDKSRQDDLRSEGPPYKESDERASAIGTGVVAIIFVGIEVGLVFAADITRCRSHFRLCRRNISRSKVYPFDRK